MTDLSIDAIQQPLTPIVFTGSTTLDRATYDLKYRPVVAKAIEKEAVIRVGCAAGCDALVQAQCSAHTYPIHVEVYVPSEDKTPHQFDPRFRIITVEGGFKKRDKAMLAGCDRVVGFFSQYAGAASGTAANLITAAAKAGKFGDECRSLDGYKVVEFLRSCALPFSASSLALVQKAEQETSEQTLAAQPALAAESK